MGAIIGPAWSWRWQAPELALVFGERALRAANQRGDQLARLWALTLVVSASCRLGQQLAVVDQAIEALRLAEQLTDNDAGAILRVELAGCARSAGVPLVGAGLLRPVVSAADSRPAVRAAALIQLAGCLAYSERHRELDGALAEADQLYADDRELDQDTGIGLRAVLRSFVAREHRRRGDLRAALHAAEEGADLLDGLGDLASDGGAGARVALQQVLGLLDLGWIDQACSVAAGALDGPVRAHSAAATGWLALAISTRVQLPAGLVAPAIALLREVTSMAERHRRDALHAESLTALSGAHEQAGELAETLGQLRSAQVIRARRSRALRAARSALLRAFGEARHPEDLLRLLTPAPPVGRRRTAERDQDNELLSQTGLWRKLDAATEPGSGTGVTLVLIDVTKSRTGLAASGRGAGGGALAAGPLGTGSLSSLSLGSDAITEGVILKVAEHLRDLTPAEAALARVGGAELAVLLPGTSRGQVERWAEELRAAMATVDWTQVTPGLAVNVRTVATEGRTGAVGEGSESGRRSARTGGNPPATGIALDASPTRPRRVGEVSSSRLRVPPRFSGAEVDLSGERGAALVADKQVPSARIPAESVDTAQPREPEKPASYRYDPLSRSTEGSASASIPTATSVSASATASVSPEAWPSEADESAQHVESPESWHELPVSRKFGSLGTWGQLPVLPEVESRATESSEAGSSEAELAGVGSMDVGSSEPWRQTVAPSEPESTEPWRQSAARAVESSQAWRWSAEREIDPATAYPATAWSQESLTEERPETRPPVNPAEETSSTAQSSSAQLPSTAIQPSGTTSSSAQRSENRQAASAGTPTAGSPITRRRADESGARTTTDPGANLEPTLRWAPVWVPAEDESSTGRWLLSSEATKATKAAEPPPAAPAAATAAAVTPAAEPTAPRPVVEQAVVDQPVVEHGRTAGGPTGEFDRFGLTLGFGTGRRSTGDSQAPDRSDSGRADSDRAHRSRRAAADAAPVSDAPADAAPASGGPSTAPARSGSTDWIFGGLGSSRPESAGSGRRRAPEGREVRQSAPLPTRRAADDPRPATEPGRTAAHREPAPAPEATQPPAVDRTAPNLTAPDSTASGSTVSEPIAPRTGRRRREAVDPEPVVTQPPATPPTAKAPIESPGFVGDSSSAPGAAASAEGASSAAAFSSGFASGSAGTSGGARHSGQAADPTRSVLDSLGITSGSGGRRRAPEQDEPSASQPRASRRRARDDDADHSPPASQPPISTDSEPTGRRARRDYSQPAISIPTPTEPLARELARRVAEEAARAQPAATSSRATSSRATSSTATGSTATSPTATESSATGSTATGSSTSTGSTTGSTATGSIAPESPGVPAADLIVTSTAYASTSAASTAPAGAATSADVTPENVMSANVTSADPAFAGTETGSSFSALSEFSAMLARFDDQPQPQPTPPTAPTSTSTFANPHGVGAFFGSAVSSVDSSAGTGVGGSAIEQPEPTTTPLRRRTAPQPPPVVATRPSLDRPPVTQQPFAPETMFGPGTPAGQPAAQQKLAAPSHSEPPPQQQEPQQEPQAQPVSPVSAQPSAPPPPPPPAPVQAPQAAPQSPPTPLPQPALRPTPPPSRIAAKRSTSTEPGESDVAHIEGRVPRSGDRRRPRSSNKLGDLLTEALRAYQDVRDSDAGQDGLSPSSDPSELGATELGDWLGTGTDPIGSAEPPSWRPSSSSRSFGVSRHSTDESGDSRGQSPDWHPPTN